MKNARPLGNVLVATDFSRGAEQAVARAVRLPLSPGTEVTILHVLAPGLAPERRPAVRAAAERTLRDLATTARAAIKARCRDVDVFTSVVEGRPHVEIARRARHHRAELIVLGRHGARTVRELLLGSTAERALRAGSTSLLIVARPPAGPYVRPLIAVDLSDISRQAAELALRVSAPAPHTMELVHAHGTIPESAIRRAGFSDAEVRRLQLDSKRQVRAALRKFLASFPDVAVGRTTILRRGDARRVILDTAFQRRPDLLVLGSHGRSGLARVLLGSVAEAVVRAVRCDVLVVHPRP